MRKSKAEKEQTHQRIVEHAAGRLRADGIQGVSIAELMGGAGLTHGGFYAHFANKEALVAEVCRRGLAQTQERMLRAVQKAPDEAKVAAMVDIYLTTLHRDHPEAGCIMPPLAGELARSPDEVRNAFTEMFMSFIERLAPAFPAADPTQQTDDALVLMSGMVGAIVIARAVNDPDLSERILQVNREFYKRSLGEPAPTP